ncbi:unnamed protein product, partial [Phaeothamnion confervicola]
MDVDGVSGSVATPSPPRATTEALKAYLVCICPALLASGDAAVASTFSAALADVAVARVLAKYSTEASTAALYIAAATSPGASGAGGTDLDGDGAAAWSGGFVFSEDVQAVVSSSSGSSGAGGLAVIKGVAGVLDAERPLSSQLQVMTIPGARDAAGTTTVPERVPDNIFSTLQLYARYSFTPLVQIYSTAAATRGATGAGGGSGGNGEVDGGVLLLQRRLRELELALIQCQKRLEIPAVRLALQPEIAEAVRDVAEDGRVDIDQLGLAERVADDAFLNAVQALVNQWVKDIQRVVRLVSSTPFPGTTVEEVNFWAGLAEALAAAQAQLRSPGVRATVELLKRAKRFLATIALDTNTGLPDAVNAVADICAFLKPMPLAPLLSAADLPSAQAALPPIFSYFGRLKNCRHYDMERVALLVESLSKAMADRLPPLICGGGRALLRAPHADATAACAQAATVFANWDEGYGSFHPFFVTLCRKRSRAGGGRLDGTEILRSLSLPHLLLKERVAAVAAFRDQHQRLAGVVAAALAASDPAALAAVEAAYAAAVAGTDALDVTEEGQRAWAAALDTYEHGVDKVDERITALLRERLGAARTADEMFGVFNQFNPLFFRERIGSAIAAFQQPLLVHVREAVELLQDKFTRRYEPSAARALAGLRDIPPLAGKVLWARQIERQLALLVRRVEAVLGPGWEQHTDGRQLRAVCDELLRNLDTQRLFLQWIEEWRAELLRRSGTARLLEWVLLVGRDRMGLLQPEVNFDEKTVALFKEVRNLLWLNVQVPEREQKILAKIQRYPSAVALRATLRSYQQT